MGVMESFKLFVGRRPPVIFRCLSLRLLSSSSTLKVILWPDVIYSFFARLKKWFPRSFPVALGSMLMEEKESICNT